MTSAQTVAVRSQLPATVRAAVPELDELGIPFEFPLSVATLPWAAAQSMAASCAAYFDGMDALVDGWAGGDHRRVAEVLRLPDDMVALWDVLPAKGWGLRARPDILLQGDRALLIEPNDTSTAALFSLSDLLVRCQRKAGIQPADPSARPLFTMARFARLLRERLAVNDGILAICYYAAEDSDGLCWGSWYYRTAVRELAELGVTARVCHVEDLEITGDGVWLDRDRVGVIHRFMEPPANPQEWEQVRRIGAAADRKLVEVLSDYRGEIFGGKGAVALLSDERFQDGLPPSLVTRLRAALPWTRLLEDRSTVYDGQRVDLLRWVLRNRSRLVLKGMHGQGGNQIVVGREVSEPEWAAAVDAGLRVFTPWLVQELVVPQLDDVLLAEDGGVVTRRLPSVYGAFVLQRQFVGAIRRYGLRGMDELNINGHLGAIPTPVHWTGVPAGAVPRDLLGPERA